MGVRLEVGGRRWCRRTFGRFDWRQWSRRGVKGHFGHQDRKVVATMKGRDMVPGKKGEKRENIYTRKGGSLTVIVCREGVVQTAQGESRKEKCEKVGALDERRKRNDFRG